MNCNSSTNECNKFVNVTRNLTIILCYNNRLESYVSLRLLFRRPVFLQHKDDEYMSKSNQKFNHPPRSMILSRLSHINRPSMRASIFGSLDACLVGSLKLVLSGTALFVRVVPVVRVVPKRCHLCSVQLPIVG